MLDIDGKTQSTIRPPIGSSPGTLVKQEDALRPTFHLMNYSIDLIDEVEITNLEDVPPHDQDTEITWLNVDGIGDTDMLQSLGSRFDLHPLALADAVNLHQRSKIEYYDDIILVVARMPDKKELTKTEQISLFIGQHFLLTIQERSGDHFDPIRDRLHQPGSKIRSRGSDYLAYAILDAIIDAYYPVLEAYGNAIEDLEEQVMGNPTNAVLAAIHQARRDLNNLRHTMWPLRETLNMLIRDDSPLISKKTLPYLRDCYDNAIQLMETIESYRDIVASLTDLYLNSVSMRMNEVMKVLTIIATIFIPLSFIAGIYGMNFDVNQSAWNMPELQWAYGYPIALSCMLLIALGLLTFFVRRGWIAAPKVRFDWRSILRGKYDQ